MIQPEDEFATSGQAAVERVVGAHSLVDVWEQFGKLSPEGARELLRRFRAHYAAHLFLQSIENPEPYSLAERLVLEAISEGTTNYQEMVKKVIEFYHRKI